MTTTLAGIRKQQEKLGREGDEKRSEAQRVLEIARERRAQAQVFIDQGAARFEARLGSGDWGGDLTAQGDRGDRVTQAAQRVTPHRAPHIMLPISPPRDAPLSLRGAASPPPAAPLRSASKAEDAMPREETASIFRSHSCTDCQLRQKESERLAAQVRALEQEARERERESAQIQDEQGIERQRAGAHVVQEQEGSASDKARAYAREGELLQHVSSLTLKHNQETKATREHAAGLERQLGELRQQLEQTRARDGETIKECEMKRGALQAQVGEMEHAQLDGHERRGEKKKRILLQLSRLEVAVAFDWFVTHCLASKVPAP